MLKEVCASCLQPVYSTEHVVTDKVCVHRSCFCCQVCRKKLSLKAAHLKLVDTCGSGICVVVKGLQNYADLHGVFYCQVHYKQMAGAKSRSEMERLEHRLGDHQVQPVAMVGRRPQPQDHSPRAKKKTETEKLISFGARCNLQLAKHKQELNSRPVVLGNKLRMSWPPSETALLDVDGKTGKGEYSWKKPGLSVQTYQAEGSRAGRMILRGQQGKSVMEAVVEKGSFLPGVTHTKERDQVCSWLKTVEQRDSEKIGISDVPVGKRGGRISQQVSAIQQGKAPLKKRSASPSSPSVLETVKSLPCGSLVVHNASHQSTKPTNWMYLRGTEGHILPAAGFSVKENKVYGSLTTHNKGGTTPTITDDKPEMTICTSATVGHKHHLGERMNSPQPICVPGEPEARNSTSKELKSATEGVDPSEYEAEEAHCLSGVSGTLYVPSGSPEPGGPSLSLEVSELENEKSKANTDDHEKEIPVASGENMQPSSTNHLPGTDSKWAEFEKTKALKPVSSSRFLEEPSPEHASQENKAEKNGVSSPFLPEMTGNHGVPCVEETEPQARSVPVLANTQEDILKHDIESPAKDFPVSADMSMKRTCATWPSHDEVNNYKSKDPKEVLSGNILHPSKQPAKELGSSKPDRSGCPPVGKDKMDLKIPEEKALHTSRPSAKSKETRSSQACREMPDKGLRLGKNSFTTLPGSEDKVTTVKREAQTQRKPTRPQSALATLFGYSSEKKQNHRENPAASSEQTNIEDRQEKPQGILSSSSQAKQEISKNNQLPQPGKTEVTPKHIYERSGSCLDSTEGKETNVLLLAPSTSISCGDQCKTTERDIHDQPALNSQVQQQWEDSCWPSLMPAQENGKEAAVTTEGGTNPLHPPPELMPAAHNSENLTRGGNHHNAHLLEGQNLLSLNDQDTPIEEGVFFSPGSSEKLPKETEIWLHNVDFLEDNDLLFSGGQDYLSIASKTSNLDLQNSEAGTPPYFGPNPSELCQEIPAETNMPLVQWDTSSLLFLAGQDEITVRDIEGIQSCAVLQQLEPQRQAPKPVGDTFGCGAEESTNEHLCTQEDNSLPVLMFTPHASDTFKQDVFDPFNVNAAKVEQKSPEKMNRSRKSSGIEEDYEKIFSANPNALNDDLSEQEFFI